jgi:hypothetical protein
MKHGASIRSQRKRKIAISLRGAALRARLTRTMHEWGRLDWDMKPRAKRAYSELAAVRIDDSVMLVNQLKEP